MGQRVKWLQEVSRADVGLVGGKNASLGELLRALRGEGIRVPDGFATTAHAYWEFVAFNKLQPQLSALLAAWQQGRLELRPAGRAIRQLFLRGRWPEPLAAEICRAYRELCRRTGAAQADVAVRSSATAEDLPEASFAGQQETFLHVRGETALLEACRRCLASLFTDRALSYRQEHRFDHLKVALSIGIQQMVRSDQGSAGVMFSLDPESGFPDVVVINAAWGLGENVVKGTVNPDEYVVFKPLLSRPDCAPIIEKRLGDKARTMVYAREGKRTTRNLPTPAARRQAYALSDQEMLQLARWACAIERHYGQPMDMEWAKDGPTGELFLVQARPETVQARQDIGALKTYALREPGTRLLQGLAIGEAIVTGTVCRLDRVQEMGRFPAGAILVTAMTDPDWVPVLRRAAGVITDHGGRTCHAAIVSRELGIPAIVGTHRATATLKEGRAITLSCAEGDQGYVYDGTLRFEAQAVDVSHLPATRTQLMVNAGSPAAAFRWWRLPSEGVGLARMEFIISNLIKVHPMALAHPERVRDAAARRQIARLTRGYREPTDYFVEHLARGIGKIAASRYPHPIIVRMSDFKTNEYANLLGGRAFEPAEENPMLGFRGASRYYSDRYREGFALECRAIRQVRGAMGFANVIVMIPFCRTLEEADRVLAELAANGLQRGQDGLEVYVMCEIPSNVLLADGFAERFDGFSIGSNDLTQLILGIDRDSALLAPLFDERNDAVKAMIRNVIRTARARGRKVGICGQAPSDYPDFAAFLVQEGIDSISLNPDSLLRVRRRVAEEEQRLSAAHA